MILRSVVKFLMTLSFLILCQNSVFSSEERGLFSCFSNNGLLSDWVYKRLEGWHNSQKSINDDYPIVPKNTFSEGIELSKNSEYNSVCLIHWTNGINAHIGTGVLTQHSEFPHKKGILTNAHLVDEKYGCYTVRFPGDTEPRKVVKSPKIINKNIDLGLLFLEEYPSIEPAKRSDERLQQNTTIFGHTAGYGNFTLPDKQNYYSDIAHETCRGIIIIPNRARHCHVFANKYSVTEHCPWYSKKSYFGNIFLQTCLSEIDEDSWISHPVSGLRIPRSITTPGFSGSPVFSEDNKLIAINASSETFTIDSYPKLSEMHSKLHTMASIYNKFSSWTKQWILGDNAHYTYAASLSYCLLQKISNSVNPAFLKWPLNNFFSYGNVSRLVLPILALQSFNIVGGALSRFKYKFPVYNVIDPTMSTSQAIILKDWNTSIDKCLSEEK